MITNSHADSSHEMISITTPTVLSKHCTEMLSVFLEELKSISIGQQFELSDKKLNDSYELKCGSDLTTPSTITLEKNNNIFQFQYLGKAIGFNSMDWYRFQKTNLSISSDIQPSRLQNNLDSFHVPKQSLSKSVSLLKKPEFLTTTGLILGGAGGAYFSPNQESKNTNIIVFGLTGAILGYFLNHFIFNGGV